MNLQVMQKCPIAVAFILTLMQSVWAQTKNIVMFLPSDQAYYSEYIVMKSALESSGYTVDVRAASNHPSQLYFHYGNSISAAASALPESSPEVGYTQFTEQYRQMFGSQWDASLNNMPPTCPVNGRIQDVNSISEYDAMVIVGGTGSLAYRVDGNYSANGTVSGPNVEAAALKLNALAVEALLAGKPVLAQCHASSLPPFWRIPNTHLLGAGQGNVDGLGVSILYQRDAAGFPNNPPSEPTLATYTSLGVTYRPDDRVIVSSPNTLLGDNGMATSRIITSRDWFPQTVAYAARTLLNVLETYPSLLSTL